MLRKFAIGALVLVGLVIAVLGFKHYVWDSVSADPVTVAMGDYLIMDGDGVIEVRGYLACAGEQQIVSAGPDKEGINSSYLRQVDRIFENTDPTSRQAFGYKQSGDSDWLYVLWDQLEDIVRQQNRNHSPHGMAAGKTYVIPQQCWVEANGTEVVMGERPFGVKPTADKLFGAPVITADN